MPLHSINIRIYWMGFAEYIATSCYIENRWERERERERIRWDWHFSFTFACWLCLLSLLARSCLSAYGIKFICMQIIYYPQCFTAWVMLYVKLDNFPYSTIKSYNSASNEFDFLKVWNAAHIVYLPHEICMKEIPLRLCADLLVCVASVWSSNNNHW